MKLLNGLFVVLCLLLITTAEGNRLRKKQNLPLATLQRLSPAIFGRSEVSGEEMNSSTSPFPDATVTTSKPSTESTTEIPKHKDNLGITKFLDSLNFDQVDKAIENLNIPEFKK
ncbi:uncharacterized protein [Drosophila kikkawai]|uniref:Uncharacterized protein n=1 Tax=Drosophila kikkawai TaxID=30033 RepID=A0ABM4GD34_DROKI